MSVAWYYSSERYQAFLPAMWNLWIQVFCCIYQVRFPGKATVVFYVKLFFLFLFLQNYSLSVLSFAGCHWKTSCHPSQDHLTFLSIVQKSSKNKFTLFNQLCTVVCGFLVQFCHHTMYGEVFQSCVQGVLTLCWPQCTSWELLLYTDLEDQLCWLSFHFKFHFKNF